uniref:Ribosomal RNA-processing protein 43 n=1 Tax=Romanomermis culicivorax TaxID=13658 RepID=A0A915KQW1_ROMCU
QPHFSDAKTNEISKTTSVLQTLLDENKIVDLNDLAIGENKNVFWILYVDVSILNCDGVLLDICLLGVSAALHATNLPCVTLVPEEMELDSVADAAQIFPDKISVSDTCRSLKCTEKSPLTSCSFLLLDSEKSANQEIIVSCDPIEFEINLFPNNILTLIIGESKDNGKPQIYGVYKYGGTCLANEETFDNCLNLAAKRKLELNNLLDQALTHR